MTSLLSAYLNINNRVIRLLNVSDLTKWEQKAYQILKKDYHVNSPGDVIHKVIFTKISNLQEGPELIGDACEEIVSKRLEPILKVIENPDKWTKESLTKFSEEYYEDKALKFFRVKIAKLYSNGLSASEKKVLKKELLEEIPEDMREATEDLMWNELIRNIKGNLKPNTEIAEFLRPIEVPSTKMLNIAPEKVIKDVDVSILLTVTHL